TLVGLSSTMRMRGGVLTDVVPANSAIYGLGRRCTRTDAPSDQSAILIQKFIVSGAPRKQTRRARCARRESHAAARRGAMGGEDRRARSHRADTNIPGRGDGGRGRYGERDP